MCNQCATGSRCMPWALKRNRYRRLRYRRPAVSRAAACGWSLLDGQRVDAACMWRCTHGMGAPTVGRRRWSLTRMSGARPPGKPMQAAGDAGCASGTWKNLSAINFEKPDNPVYRWGPIIFFITEILIFTSPPTWKCDILLYQYYYVLVINVKCFRDNLCNFLEKLDIF